LWLVAAVCYFVIHIWFWFYMYLMCYYCIGQLQVCPIVHTTLFHSFGSFPFFQGLLVIMISARFNTVCWRQWLHRTHIFSLPRIWIPSVPPDGFCSSSLKLFSWDSKCFLFLLVGSLHSCFRSHSFFLCLILSSWSLSLPRFCFLTLSSSVLFEQM
jgi:hypothetical protein